MFCISDSTEFGHIFSTFSDGYGRRCYREKDAGNIVNTREMRDEMRRLTVIVCTGTDPVANKTEHGRDTRGRVDTEVQGHSWDMWVKRHMGRKAQGHSWDMWVKDT